MPSVGRNSQARVQATYVGFFTEDTKDGPLPTWKVYSASGTGATARKSFIGFIHKMMVTKPFKANVYVGHDKNHIQLGIKYTLRDALKMYERNVRR